MYEVGSILKPQSYNEYEYREARARLFKAFLAVIVLVGFYGWITIQVVFAEGIVPVLH